MTSRTALIAGANGLVGSHLLHLLLADESYKKVRALVRRALPIEHPKLDQRIIDFDSLELHAQVVSGNDVFCCLGTTMKKAGSKAAFEKVDFTYPYEIAKIARVNGATQFLVVTAIGADPHSSVFYNRVKGRIEEAVTKLPYRAVHVFRPSLLHGDRQASRPLETLGIFAMRLAAFAMVGRSKKYRPIQAATVAQAVLNIARKNLHGIHVYESDQIQTIGSETTHDVLSDSA